MARDNSSSKLPKKKVAKKAAKKVSKKTTTKKVTKKESYPKIYKDKENAYVSIKLKAGIETKSYMKSGILFLENDAGEVIEVQVF